MATALSMTRGDTFPINLAVSQAGSPFNLTNCTLRMTAKWAYSDLDNAAVFTRSTSTAGIIITNAALGLATITVVPSSTASLPPNIVRLVYDIQVTDSGNNPYTVATGVLTVSPDVSITTP